MASGAALSWRSGSPAAARSTSYSSGNDETDLARVGWYGKNSGGRTHRVGEKSANGHGLYDMHGNVWEWTRSPWTDDYSGREGGIEVDPSAVDPADLAGGPRVRRVLRGGGYGNPARVCRSACRDRGGPWIVFGIRGFRVLLSSAPSRPSTGDHRS
jgi:formylglycine-generating enzyme required for sulfatase activity